MNDFIASLMLLGAMLSSDAYLPFWMTANQYGLMPERNGSLMVLSAETQYDESATFQHRWGASLGANSYNNPLDPGSSPAHVMVDQLYASLRWNGFTLDLGQKHRENDFLGASPALGSLSVTGGHLVESGNARPMPGYLVTMDPVAVPLTKEHFWLFGFYGDYKTTDNRYMKDALVHRMQLGFRLTPVRRLSLDFVIDHYALWGGANPDGRSMNVNVENYLRVITGRHAGSDGTMSDRINVIGDHGGAELLRAAYKGDGWRLVAQHDIPYSDGSGMSFQNFPDGVNTLSFSWDDKARWISDVLYEYHYTMFQSGPIHVETFDENGNSTTPPGSKTYGMDNYFNNGEYKSAWSHHGRGICAPTFLPRGTYAGSWTSANMFTGFENNRYTGHHFGLGGKLFRKHPYKLMLTYTTNYGTYGKSYIGENPAQKEWGTVHETGLRQVSGAFTGSFENLAGVKGLSVIYGFYADKGSLLADQIGATLGIRYTLGR